MKSFSHRLAFAFTLTAILWTTSTAMAQRRSGGGFGGFGGFGGGGGSGSTVGILLRDSNAEELKLTDEQKTKIREISDKLAKTLVSVTCLARCSLLRKRIVPPRPPRWRRSKPNNAPSLMLI